ncbi:glycosyltransferase family 2 protein [Olsenella profusa]|uniref:Glycosyltransferase family 2 protein n=2 Tax=Olsenella profusa TaxID=138595 RepID=A0ABS2F1D5_9ACTN|nr:glycosyltransferase family 2 protein [Olsenella profusa]
MVAHDAERSVRRAVESLQNQTLTRIELVVVDAGSEDSTARQLDAIAERDLRVVVVHADRCGRQRGLDLALERSHGAWLAVMDTDGWARPTMLADLLGRAEERSADLVVGGYSLAVSEGDGRPSEVTVEDEGRDYPTQHDFRSDAWRLLGSGQLLPASAKLFSRERAEACGARFAADGEAEDDHSFVLSYLRETERVSVLPGTCYHVSRRLSASRPGTERAWYRRLEAEHAALLELYRHWGLEGDAASMETIQDRYVGQLIDCIEDVCRVGGPADLAQCRKIVEGMLGTDQARVAVSVAHPSGSHARSLMAPIRARNTALVCAQARLLSLFRRGRVAESTVPDAFI